MRQRGPLHPATWLFYACGIFFVGLFSVAQGGPVFLATVVMPTFISDPETLARVFVVLTIALSAIFLVGGFLALTTRARDARESAN